MFAPMVNNARHMPPYIFDVSVLIFYAVLRSPTPNEKHGMPFYTEAYFEDP